MAAKTAKKKEVAEETLPALVGHFAEVVDGEYEGKYGVFDSVATTDKDGEPENVFFVTRDDDAQTLVVKFKDLAPAVAGRR